MRSIFRYPGGKTRRSIQDWIVGMQPPVVSEYREPFVGGGGVFFHTPTHWNRWINDKHTGLISVYESLRDRPDRFIALCRSIASPSESDPLTDGGIRGGKKLNARLKAVFDSLAFNTECDQALRYFFINRTVFGGRVNYDIPSRLYFSNPEGWRIIDTDLLGRAAQALAGVRITVGDYRELFEEPGENVWIYADPPYVVNSGFHPSSQLYQHSFTEEDHHQLASVIKACKHNVALSYDDDAESLVRTLYPEPQFTILTKEWRYCGTTNEEKAIGRELLVLNYEPSSLFALTSTPIGSLTEEEQDDLAECEAAIHRATRSFVEAGESLFYIRQNRLYRGTHPTFDDYCRQRWGMRRAHSYRLIESFLIISHLSPMGDKQPDSERQTRELARLRESSHGPIAFAMVEGVWSRVVERAEKESLPITAKLIRSEVEATGCVEAKPKADPVDQLFKGWQRLSESQRQTFLDRIKELNHDAAIS